MKDLNGRNNDEIGGSCGTNLIWTLNDRTLVISGSGAMKNYNSDDIMWVQKARVSAKRDIEIYENGQKDSKVITTISKNDEFKILGSIDSIEPDKSLSYVQYNDAEGWAFITYSDYDYLETLQ